MSIKRICYAFCGCMCLLSVSCEDTTANDEVLLDVNFDSHSTGIYSEAELAQDWGSPRWSRGISDGRVSLFSGADAYKGNSLRIIYPKGAVGMRHGGAGWRTSVKESETIWFSYSIRFKEGYEFVRGGKLPGLGGGKSNTGGKAPSGRDGWSSRFMWRSGGRLSAYVYHADQPTKYGEHFDATGKFTPGRWHRLKMRVSMNTPGKRNGSVSGWLDGEKVIDVNNLRFRDISSIKIDKVLFETFFGGSGASYAPTRSEYVDFDEFKVWKEVR